MEIKGIKFGYESRVNGKGKLEKCPVCREIGGGPPFFCAGVSLELGGEFVEVDIFVCPKPSCRSVFVPSYVDLKMVIDIQSKFLCECGFIGKDERGLKVHQKRFCKSNDKT